MAATTEGQTAGPTWLKGIQTWFSSASKSAKVFARIFSYASPGDRIFVVFSVITSICAGATLPLMNIVFARLVRAFESLSATSPDEVSTVFMSIINEYVLYIVYLFIGRFILAYIAILGFRNTSLRISAAVRLSYLQSLFLQPISVLDALPPGQTTAIITITANILQLGISERVASLIQAIAVIVTALVIGCIYSWALTLVTATGLLAIVIWYGIVTPIVAKKYADVQELDRQAAGVASETLSSIRMVAACGAEEKMTKRYNDLVEQTRAVGKKLSPIMAIQHAPVFFTIYATFALCFWFAVKLYLDLQFSNVETLVVVLMSIMTMLAHINAISIPLTAASNAINAATIFFTIIDAPKPTTSGVCGAEVSLDQDIVLDNINFAYPTRHEVKILTGLNLRIPAGKTTAIVGPSGSGKSTTVALIQRWYELGGADPVTNYLRNGSIKIGDKNLNEIDLFWWRSQIGFVQQEPFLFNDTVAKNVEYGLVGTEHEFASEETKRQLVEQACKEAYADDFIRLLPQGYSTPVGEVGMQFSGGQRQRIAIARAIISAPKILIFDEATSALDVTSERIVQRALEKVSQSRTTIVIAHRLSTIRKADNIVVLAKGSVVQQGTHESLLAEEGGAYWKLVNAQELAAAQPVVDDPMEQPVSYAPSYAPSFTTIEKENYDSTFETEHTSKDKDSIELIRMDEKGPKPVPLAKKPANAKPKAFFASFGMLLVEQRSNWFGYFFLVIAAMGAAASYPIQAYLFARLISSFTTWGEQLRLSTSFLCIMLVIVAFGVGASYFAIGWISNATAVHTISTYRKEYFSNIISKRISFFDEPSNSAGLLTARIATDPAQLQQLLGVNMAMVLISLFNLVGCITIAIFFHWKFGLVVIASSLPVILAGGWYRVRHEVKFEARNNEVFSESARFATEAIGSIRTVASLTLERPICDKYSGLLQYHVDKSWKEARISCMVFAASDSMVLLCMAFALWYGGKLLATFELDAFTFLVVYLAIIQGSLAAGQWLSFGPDVAQVSAAADRIQGMRANTTDDDALAKLHREHSSRHISTSMIHKGADIDFQDVWFTYPTRNVPVLRGLSLSIQHGQFAAIVGSSGSGKTTVISLLERFYEPHTGAILYNNEDISSVPLETLRKRMSLVAQEPTLFRGTIRENVLLGMTDGEVAHDALEQACRDAGIHDFIASLPSGYDTDVGTGGVALSGGQKQRLSIARALIRNPSLLLLDEATSSLDAETEREVQAVFERTGAGRTMVVVAHRLATVQNADVIFVMHQGEVVEKGDHQSLLRIRGWYWQMCQAQSLGS